MAVKITAPSLVRNFNIQLSLALDQSNQHGLDSTSLADGIRISVPTYVFSSKLPAESPDDKILTLASLAEGNYHGIGFNSEIGLDTDSPSAPRYYCIFVTLSTEGDWMVSFMLQAAITMEEEDATDLIAGLATYTGNSYPSRVVRSIGEESKNQIKKWRDKTIENIDKRLKEARGYRACISVQLSARVFPV
ncbi:hypothetical protein FANTH_14178 [Fusarium anthophilum]|uniref:Uncharacterized protein n=1 Tax=Fusarium anthophilum TaxID=48485 RepID=A0A8H4YJZ5_9HYPO|nr:hypothetical protein FANTH_14178 [Fusarium anthophilum]